MWNIRVWIVIVMLMRLFFVFCGCLWNCLCCVFSEIKVVKIKWIRVVIKLGYVLVDDEVKLCIIWVKVKFCLNFWFSVR